jgi:hypothetical protein
MPVKGNFVYARYSDNSYKTYQAVGDGVLDTELWDGISGAKDLWTPAYLDNREVEEMVRSLIGSKDFKFDSKRKAYIVKNADAATLDRIRYSGIKYTVNGSAIELAHADVTDYIREGKFISTMTSPGDAPNVGKAKAIENFTNTINLQAELSGVIKNKMLADVADNYRIQQLIASWSVLSNGEKDELIRFLFNSIADARPSHKKCNLDIKPEANNIPDAGYYDPDSNTVVVRRMPDFGKVLNTVVHEFTHCQQWTTSDSMRTTSTGMNMINIQDGWESQTQLQADSRGYAIVSGDGYDNYRNNFLESNAFNQGDAVGAAFEQYGSQRAGWYETTNYGQIYWNGWEWQRQNAGKWERYNGKKWEGMNI